MRDKTRKDSTERNSGSAWRRERFALRVRLAHQRNRQREIDMETRVVATSECVYEHCDETHIQKCDGYVTTPLGDMHPKCYQLWHDEHMFDQIPEGENFGGV